MTSFDKAINSLNIDKVQKEISSEGFSGDVDLIYGWVETACNHWLEEDFNKFKKVELLEQEISFPKGKGVPAIKGIIDLCVRLKNKKKLVIDWKSTSGVINDKWVQRHRKSWQWRIYAYLTGADQFEYRGISSFPPYVKSVSLTVPSNNDKQVEDYLKGEYGCMEFLRNSDFTNYPKNWGACDDFSSLCPYYQDCKNSTEPQRVPGQLVVLSYSRLATFGSCKERFRRDMLLKEAEELGISGPSVSSPVQEKGKAFHRGVAEVYRQVFSL